MKIEERRQEFLNPGMAYRAKPFWSWNGKLEGDELIRQIDIMKEMGFGGFFMHSRTGLETEYLGKEWFQLINECADYGHQEGLETWLYDEDRWPSGSAGGLVTRYKKYRAKFIEMDIKEAGVYRTNRWSKNTVAVFACRLDGEIMLSKRRLSVGEPLFEDEKAVVFKWIYAENNDNYNGYTYVDTMNKEAIEYYIKLTHEKYRKKCGKRLGKEIQGIFTDEPHRGPCFTSFSGGSNRRVPYTDVLFEEFESRFGYDLIEKLPELFLRKEVGELSRVTRDYFELTQELFLENFAIPIQKWCKENNMIITGHVLHEDALTCQATMQGSLMRYYEYMDYPGIDLLGEYKTCYWVATQINSTARQMGKKWILSELDGCTGWQMNFQSYKNIGDWQALYGVNLRCPHLSWYTMKGEAKRDYPASILHQSPWYGEYSYVEDYFARIHAALFDGENECSLLVINPIESIWARAYSGCFDMLTAADPEMLRLEEQYAKTYRMLAAKQINFDYGEEDILARHAKAEQGILKVGQVSYKKVLVSGVDTMRSSTVKLLREFMANGGTVIFAGEIPAWVDAEPSEEVKILAKNAVCIPFEENAVAAACREEDGILIVGETSEFIGVQSKQIEGGRIVMLLNMDKKQNSGIFEVRLGSGSGLEQWNARTGEIFSPGYAVRDGMVWITLDLEAGGERLFFLPEGVVSEAPKAEKPAEVQWEAVTIAEELKYRLNEKNVCVLDYMKLLVDDGFETDVQEVLKADRSLREHLGIPYRGGEMLQPWYSVKYCGGDTQKLCTVTQKFYVAVEKLPSGVQLAIEDLRHVTKLQVNGTEIALQPVGKWRDICFDCLEIPDQLWKVGENQITVQMDYYKTCGFEALYLLGSFGVTVNADGSTVLNELPDTLKVGDISEQGLPFYSGSVVYELPQPEGIYQVKMNRFGGALTKAVGAEEKPMAFEPYETCVKDLKAIEVILTSRNTFGPLHQLPKVCATYGPGSFVTEGKQWTDSYVLYEQGLLEKPQILKRK